VAEKLRILFFAEQFWPSIGGVEVLSAKLVRALHATGHQVVVTTSHSSFDAPDIGDMDGVQIHRFRFLDALSTRRLDLWEANYRRLLRLRQDFRPQVVHVCDTGGSVLFHLRAQARERIPTLLGLQNGSSPEHARRDGVLRRALQEADHIAVVSQAVLHDVERIAPEAAHRCSVILNGLEMPTLIPAPLDFERPRLVCAGRLVEDKGFDIALRAFARVHARCSRARLTIAGDGPARESLESLAVSLGIRSQVDFPGWVVPEQIPELMNSATVFVMPSRWREAFGLVTLEAMQMSRPVIATRVGGTPEIVVDGETGMLVPAEDHQSMAAGITTLLENPALATKMGDAGRRRAIEKFGFETYRQALESLYFQLAGSSQNDRLKHTSQFAD
jgi:glycogen(starch) synthase